MKTATPSSQSSGITLESANQTARPRIVVPPYCGQDLVPDAFSKVRIRSGGWNPETVLDAIHRAPLALSAADLASRRDFFLSAAQTEFDAEFLCRYLEASGTPWSPEFLAFEHAWRRDEHLHYVAFRRLFARLYPDAGERVVAETVESATPDFSPIAAFLADEFHVLTAIAFDEACTARSYAEEIPFYERLGAPVFPEWIRAVARDEVHHCINAIAVLRACHANRLGEAPDLIDSFLVHDASHQGYRNTFLFDHWAYAPEFLRRVAQRLKAQISASH